MKKIVLFGSVAALVMALFAKENSDKQNDTDTRLRLIMTMAMK